VNEEIRITSFFHSFRPYNPVSAAMNSMWSYPEKSKMCQNPFRSQKVKSANEFVVLCE